MTTIGSIGMQQGALAGPAAAALPTRIPEPVAAPVLPTNRAAVSADADEQVLADPLRPTAADGWSPDQVVAVHSRNKGGFMGSALNFALGGVEEQPGQRLSRAQVDQLAPFYARQFGIDETYVRGELAKVYVYVGGPSTTAQQAMTIGHHVFVPDERSLDLIMGPRGKHWLAHELSHTMQFLTYEGGSPQRFLADYFTSMAVGQDPVKPGSGGGRPVWGALFTAMRSAGHPEEDLGKAATTMRDRFVSSILPASTIAVPLALVASGGLAAARATTGLQLLGSGNSMKLAMAGIAAPALVGSTLGAFEDQIGSGWAKGLGAAAGGAMAGAALLKSGAFGAIIGRGATPLASKLGRGAAIGLAAGAVLSGAAIGFLSASASANTIQGWSNSAQELQRLRNRPAGEAPENLTFQDALHDSHWIEIDAESVARTFMRGEWDKPLPGEGPIGGRVPTDPVGIDKVDRDLGARLDWGVKIPLLLGVPAAIGVGAGVLGGRTGLTLLKTTIRDGRGVGEAVRESLKLLGSQSRGVGNSLGIGAAATVAPLMAGGLVGPIAYDITGSETFGRITGAATGGIVSGALLTTLLKGRGASPITTGIQVGVGALVGAGLGLLASGVATDALRPGERDYDVEHGASSAKPAA